MSTSEDAAPASDFRNRIDSVTLPEPVGTLATEYEQLFGDRDRFLWRWIYSLFPEFTLSSVPAEHAQEVRTQKTVLTMYVTVLDDLVEHREDLRTFEEARRFAYARGTVDGSDVAVDDEQFEFIERLWDTFEASVTGAPRYDEFEEVFAYDIRQTTNAMHYSAVVNGHPRIANLDGARRYDAHNMAMFPYADVDLMYSPAFDLGDFGAVRDLLWDLQELARIGNWLTTWERELKEGDYTAGIVVQALQDGVVEPAMLHGAADEALVAIREAGIEDRFRRRWKQRYSGLRAREFTTESVDLGAMVDGMQTVFEYHRESRGHK